MSNADCCGDEFYNKKGDMYLCLPWNKCSECSNKDTLSVNSDQEVKK